MSNLIEACGMEHETELGETKALVKNVEWHENLHLCRWTLDCHKLLKLGK